MLLSCGSAVLWPERIEAKRSRFKRVKLLLKSHLDALLHWSPCATPDEVSGLLNCSCLVYDVVHGFNHEIGAIRLNVVGTVFGNCLRAARGQLR